MGDCERGTLAVTTSEKISKNNYLQLSIPKNLVKLHAQKYITQIRNVIFNFPSTGFLKKQCKLTLPTLSSPLFSVPLYPPVLLPDPPSNTLTTPFLYCTCLFLTSLSGHLRLTELFNL